MPRSNRANRARPGGRRPVWAVGLILTGLINLAIFIVVPLLSNQPVGQPRDRVFDPIYLRAYRPPPPERERPPARPIRPVTENKPREKPDRPRFNQAVKKPQPKVDLKSPKLTFELNPKLVRGLAVAPPPVTARPEPPTPPPVASAPAPRPPGEFNLNQVDNAPRLIKHVPPIYPYSARRRGVSGLVKIKMLVTSQGQPSRVKVVSAQPGGVFESAALRAVRKWRFKPGVYKGKPVPTWVVVPIRFKLSG